MDYEEATSFSALYDAMWKCRRGKMWKASVANFVINGVQNVLKLADEIDSGKYEPKTPHVFNLYYPKKRECASQHIRDRVVQRSVNDNILYPKMTHSFIWDNTACQNGKGTTFAMDRLDRQLHRYYINNNNSNEGWVLQCDLRQYYQHISHEDARQCFQKKLGDALTDTCMRWLDKQYPGEVGYAPGSQMVQILGISLLDPFDHTVKERLRAKVYERCMDDFLIVSNDKAYLQNCLKIIEAAMKKLNMELHPKKTHIYKLKDGIKFLGFTFLLTDTGKVVRLIDPDNVHHERKKLYRMAQQVKRGEMTLRKFYECYNSWKAHAAKGNSYKLLQRMDKYAKKLLEVPMKIVPLTGTLYQRTVAENQAAEADRLEAEKLYNEMIGTWVNPKEEEPDVQQD